MNLKLKRTSRTPSSEEVLIFDAENRDENDAPVNIGKADIHYLSDQIVGTLLLWQEFVTGFSRIHGAGSEETLDGVIDAIMSEISEPLGVPGEYGVEVYFPSVQNYQFISSYAEDDDDEDDAATSDERETQVENASSFSDQLRSRP